MQNQPQENDLFLNAFQYAPIGIALVDLDGTWLKVNPALCKLLGYTEAEFLMTNFQDLSHLEDLDADLELVEKTLAGEIDSFQLEKRYYHKEGHTVWALLSVSLVHNSDRSPRYFISQILDISKIKMAESKINELTAKNMSILDTITDAFYSLDEEWRFVYLNKEAEKQLGKKNAELQGKLLWDAFPSLEHNDYGSYFRDALLQKVTITFEEYVPANQESNEKWLETHIYPTKEGLSVYFQDVTDRKATEEKLRESEEWFRMLADYSTDMISRHTVRGICTYVSAICYTLLGYKPHELIGTKVYDLFHPEDLYQVLESFTSIVNAQQISTHSYRMRRKDGSYIWFESTSRTIRDKRGKVTEIIAVSRDITERKVTEMKMQETNDLLMRLSITDGLTGIANRRSFDHTMEREWGVAARYGQPLSLLLCDIDFFKAYNDTYGHQGGDHCLQLVAHTLKKTLNRPNDFAARYGGEEFSIILPNTDKRGALKVSEFIKRTIEDLKIPHASSRVSDVVTVSIGVATLIPNPSLSINMLIEYTDKALYLAKQGGRNRVVVHE
ncbi:PAS domain S-box protein [Paenibacillus agricola]|uniref:PAS domain S-box protein n=1 Tax=Paenibacillus agricola TaxID=2716264 RepID=A0ABX0J2Z7_9BACL|nr:PAS domain S-box protein [Paenibacillus agricola]NHN29494.1 PAS domain S-box protein [Paenibacillus agricola]